MDLVPEEEQPEPDDPDETFHSDEEARDTVLYAVLPHITLTNDKTSTVPPPACVSS